jgi:hypothetical protein
MLNLVRLIVEFKEKQVNFVALENNIDRPPHLG